MSIFMGQLGDYFELTKPRVCLLLVFTAGAGMIVAPAAAPWPVALVALAGIWLACASAASFNHLIERQIDRTMRRTAERPLASNRLNTAPVIGFGVALACASMYLLIGFVNLLTAAMTLASLAGYAFVYTIWLKRATPQNIVIGGVFGASPPLLGYAAVSGETGIIAWQMFLIIFLWTPPHFWALAIARKEDYLKSGLPMLPVTHGSRYAALNILLYTVLLLLATALPWLTFQAGMLYLVSSLVLGAGYFYFSWQAWRSGQKDKFLASFYYSIHYLIWLFAFLVIDRVQY